MIFFSFCRKISFFTLSQQKIIKVKKVLYPISFHITSFAVKKWETLPPPHIQSCYIPSDIAFKPIRKIILTIVIYIRRGSHLERNIPHPLPWLPKKTHSHQTHHQMPNKKIVTRFYLKSIAPNCQHTESGKSRAAKDLRRSSSPSFHSRQAPSLSKPS